MSAPRFAFDLDDNGIDANDFLTCEDYELDELDEFELARQARIAAGEEYACAGCGCSETHSCSGGCIWATPTLCSRCAQKGVL